MIQGGDPNSRDSNRALHGQAVRATINAESMSGYTNVDVIHGARQQRPE